MKSVLFVLALSSLGATPALENQEAVAAVDRETAQYVAALGYRLGCAECRFIVYDDRLGLRVPGFGTISRPTVRTPCPAVSSSCP